MCSSRWSSVSRADHALQPPSPHAAPHTRPKCRRQTECYSQFNDNSKETAAKKALPVSQGPRLEIVSPQRPSQSPLCTSRSIYGSTKREAGWALRRPQGGRSAHSQAQLSSGRAYHAGDEVASCMREPNTAPDQHALRGRVAAAASPREHQGCRCYLSLGPGESGGLGTARGQHGEVSAHRASPSVLDWVDRLAAATMCSARADDVPHPRVLPAPGGMPATCYIICRHPTRGRNVICVASRESSW